MSTKDISYSNHTAIIVIHLHNRFLADFAPETLEKSGRKSLIQALMRFLTDSVLETFEKHGFAGPAGKRAKASTERGCRDTTPIS